MDLHRYIEKNPLKSYCIGPSGSGISQAQPFNTEWVGWLEPSKGVFFQKYSEYGNGTPSFIPDVSLSNSSKFSFTFDSGNGVWYAGEADGLIKIVGLSGFSYSFSGNSPQLYNNSVLVRGQNVTHCFYTKGAGSIYFKTSSENFANERLVYSGLEDIRLLTQVIKLQEPYLYRFGLFGLKNNGNGFFLKSQKQEPITTGFTQDFNEVASGEVTILPSWKTEERYGHFIQHLNFYNNDFSALPTGLISGKLDSGILYNYLPNAGDSFETSPTGTIISLVGSNNMSGGYFIYG